jgi:hypothetical protein
METASISITIDLKEVVDVLATAKGPKTERLAAQRAFLQKRAEIWKHIEDGRFPSTYVSADRKKFVGAPRRTAIRCDFLLANKIALGPKYRKDRIADLAQRDLLFYVLRAREVFPNRTGKKFYCCPKCTSKLYECVSFKIFRYIDNAKWKAQIENGRDEI